MRIYLIRHGQSVSDVKQKYDGDYDDHLTENGKKEALIIADKLKGNNIGIVLSSPKFRSKETARIICDTLNCGMKIIDDFAEQNIYGAYQELGKRYPEEEYRKLGEILVDRNNAVNGAEPYADFKHRVSSRFSAIIANNSNDVVAIVTHGGPIRCLFREILKGGELERIDNGAIIELDKDGSGIRIVGFDGINFKQRKEHISSVAD